MIERRVLSSNYLGVGLAIATGLLANLGSVPQARAQADLNVQSRLDTIMPPVTAQLPTSTSTAGPGQTNVPKGFTALNQNASCVPTESLRGAAATISVLSAKNSGALAVARSAASFTQQEIKDIVQGYFNGGYANFTEEQRSKIKIAVAAAVNPNPDTGCLNRQAAKVQISLPFNPTYETNILRSGNNSSPGDSAGFGGSVTVASGVDGRPWDFVILNAQEASTRYAPNFSPSVDGLSQQASYQLFLHAYGYDPKTKTFADNLVPGSPTPPGGLMTFDTLTFGVLNQTAFAPTFKTEKSDFLTPQLSLARQNIGFDDSSGTPCVTSDTKFCYYANLSMTAGQSFSDVRTLENVNFAASATLGWNINGSNWSLTLPATATAKDYEHVVGGRRDLQLQAGPALMYSSQQVPLSCAKDTMYAALCSEESISFTFKLPVTYYKNYSTLSTAAWSGWVIMPTLTITFGYSEPTKGG